jgi:hypothetical protein
MFGRLNFCLTQPVGTKKEAVHARQPLLLKNISVTVYGVSSLFKLSSPEGIG